jgi:hypothetical protein
MYFLSIIHRYNQDKVDWLKLDSTNGLENLKLVVELCGQLGRLFLVFVIHLHSGVNCTMNPSQFVVSPSSAVVILLLNQYASPFQIFITI